MDNASVTYEYGPRNKYSFRIKLEKLPAFEFRTNAKYITIDYVQDSGLHYAINKDFDKWLSEFATIISPTEDEKDRDTGFYTGRKKHLLT